MSAYMLPYTGPQIKKMLNMLAKGTAQPAICTQCGAPLNADGVCEYCGTRYAYVLKKVEQDE